MENTVTSRFDTTQIPGYIAGTWTIDPVHSDLSFKVRHLMVANVRGKFHGVTGTLVLAEDPARLDRRGRDRRGLDRHGQRAA